jgi:hypothetical protein
MFNMEVLPINNFFCHKVEILPSDKGSIKKQFFFRSKGLTMKHYKNLCSSKPHYRITKIQKKIHIQLLCNYPLGITTTMQLSP